MLIIRLAHTAHMPTPGELMQKLPKISPSSPPNAPPAPAAPVASAPVASSVETAPIETGAGMPSSLAEIVALAETNGEMLLAARIRNHVKLVSL